MEGRARPKHASPDNDDLHDNSLRWHDPEQVYGYDLSPHFKGTPAITLHSARSTRFQGMNAESRGR
jgi:hypothetical protein